MLRSPLLRLHAEVDHIRGSAVQRGVQAAPVGEGEVPGEPLLGLAKGKDVYAVIKASSVMLGVDH
jgi:hypothetical protein